MSKWGLFQGCKADSVFKIQCNSPGEQGKEGKPHEHINWGRKYIWQNSIPIHDRNSQKTKTRVEFP